MSTMQQIAIGLQGHNGPLQGQHVTARGLHGLLYHVLKLVDPQAASWLHNHPPPKPYTLLPYYDAQQGLLAGLLLRIFSDPAGEALFRAWEGVRASGRELWLGPQSFYTRDVATAPGPGFEALAARAPAGDVRLRFLSPTAFKQGPGHLPLPLPGNVFSRPVLVWRTYAPPTLPIPGDWQSWCEQNVFVVAHDIATATVTISKREPPFTGFVGEVHFRAESNNGRYLSMWQGLAGLAAYCGVGHKTTMGLGAVETIDARDQ